MCGIFAYLNFNVSRERRYILEVLFNGLRRLEYRGYDSAGISIDSSFNSSNADVVPPPLVFRKEGNIESLVKSVYQGNFSLLHMHALFRYVQPLKHHHPFLGRALLGRSFGVDFGLELFGWRKNVGFGFLDLFLNSWFE